MGATAWHADAATHEALIATRTRIRSERRGVGEAKGVEGADALKDAFHQTGVKNYFRVGQNWAKLSLLVHTSMPPLGTDGVGGDLSKGPVAMDPTPRDTPAGTTTNSTSPSPGTRTPDGARTPGSDKNAIGQSTAPTSPIESAALRSRVIALENELAEAKTLAANPSSVELAALRSKSISLEAELELAKTDGAKSEEAMGGMLRMQRAMSSAQKAKITQLHEQNAALEAQITALKGQVQEARAAAEDADSSREELRREAERFESHVNEALDQKEAEWERANDTAVRRVQAELVHAKELTRKMLLAHAAAKLRWAAERASLIEEGASRSSMNSAAAVGREARRAAETNAHGVDNRALASGAVASTAPGTALHALLAATTRRKPAEGATNDIGDDEDDRLVAELLRDAMEEEVAAAIERGYYVDDAGGGAVVVGANAIVEKIVAKYKSTEGGPDGGVGAEKDRESEPVAEVRTPGHTPIDVDDAEDDTEEGTWRKERAVLVAELARARAATEVAEARAATKDSEANEEESYASTAAAYEAEEASAVAALELAAEVRAARLDLELKDLRRRMVSPTQLRNVLGEIKELRAKTDALKSGCVMTQRLVKPTIESAIACLRLDATAGTRAAMDDAATGVQATSERSPRLDTADASTAGSSMAPHRSSRSTGPHQHQPIPPSAAAARAPVFNARAGTPHTPADSSYRESLRTPTDESFGTSGVRTEDLPETFRTAMDGLGFSSTLRKSAAVLVAEAEADAAKRSLASAAKKALASIMDSPAGGTKHR